jgi:hypothetical protein
MDRPSPDSAPQRPAMVLKKQISFFLKPQKAQYIVTLCMIDVWEVLNKSFSFCVDCQLTWLP